MIRIIAPPMVTEREGWEWWIVVCADLELITTLMESTQYVVLDRGYLESGACVILASEWKLP